MRDTKQEIDALFRGGEEGEREGERVGGGRIMSSTALNQQTHSKCLLHARGFLSAGKSVLNQTKEVTGQVEGGLQGE